MSSVGGPSESNILSYINKEGVYVKIIPADGSFIQSNSYFWQNQ